MNNVSNAAGVAGILLCLGSMVVRLQGHAYVYHYETLSFFLLGVGLMVFGCFVKLSLK